MSVNQKQKRKQKRKRKMDATFKWVGNNAKKRKSIQQSKHTRKRERKRTMMMRIINGWKRMVNNAG